MSQDHDIEQWTALVAAEARGRQLDADEQALCAAVERAHPELAAEAVVWRLLGRHGDAAPEVGASLSDAELCLRVLAKARDQAMHRGRRWRQSGLAAAACVLVGLMLYALLGARSPRLDSGTAPASAAPMSSAPAPAEHVVWVLPGARARLAPASCAVVTHDLEVCAPIGATIEVERVDENVALRLVAGAIDVFGADEPRLVRLETPTGTVLGDGGVFTVAVTPEGPRIRRFAGELELRAPPVEDNRAPGPVATPVSTDAPTAPESPEELLERAQQRLVGGDTRRAIEAYETLLKRHPRSVEARTALVSLGNLLLLRGQHTRALRYYERYLDAPGELAEEAFYGKIGALHGLGRFSEVRTAATEFLARYPDSLYVRRVRAWLRAASGGDRKKD